MTLSRSLARARSLAALTSACTLAAALTACSIGHAGDGKRPLASEDGLGAARPPSEAAVDTQPVAPAHVHITLEGVGYGIGGKTVATSDHPADAPAAPAVFRPGPAELRVAFSSPVDRDEVWKAIRDQLVGAATGYRIELGQPVWDESGKSLAVRLQQTVTPLGAGVFDGRPSLRLDLSTVKDVDGAPVDPAGAALEWLVVRPVTVYAISDPAQLLDGTTEGRAVGELAALPSLRPAGPRPWLDGHLLMWRFAAEEAECDARALVDWNLSAGTALDAGAPVDACLSWAGWDPQGHDLLLTSLQTLVRLDLDGGEPEPVYRVPDDRLLVGMAIAPDGRIALFEATPPAGGAEVGSIDLLVVDLHGKVMAKVPQVSDLVSEEGLWRPIQASWSDDGEMLAFTALRVREHVSEPAALPDVSEALSVWRPKAPTGTGPEELDVPVTTVSWRPGTHQILVGDRLYDVDTKTSRKSLGDVKVLPYTDVFWSPDGRYMAFLDPSQGRMRGVLVDLETGRGKEGDFLPLGWEPATGQFYWCRTRVGVQ
ncbi:MAG: PD40 domain-containing protein [Clostridia bacterium]|nr:PD40 domain-containing protein [Clostridia bacterium]